MFELVSVSVPIRAAGGVMWDGKYITLTDQKYDFKARTAIYRIVAVGPRRYKVVSATMLLDPCRGSFTDVLAPFVVGQKNTPASRDQGRTVIGSNHICPGTFDFWTYPGGGNPAISLTLGPQYAAGQSVSVL